ncbi:lysine--tRNA ligase [Candidatus Gottesmanbacteria bacterium]|nr:lysine--tRNA ligase [Candidatus Gottesmanbacteria bacterium]
MFWADKIAEKIRESGAHTPYWVDDMFTPSGFAHIGSLRGPLVHDIVYRALKDTGSKTKFTYVFNDFDSIDGLPPELYEKSKKYLGFPLRTAPSPMDGYASFAEYFTKDFQKVLLDLGFGGTFLSSYDMYHEGKFDGVIKEALENSEKILDIYQKVSGSKKRESGWLPLQVICEKCGKLGTTRVHDFDGKTVGYTCEPAMVTWASGCGHTGRILPFGGNGKLPWKVDWPAHWKVLGVTIEGAGKDHSSAGGSRDIAKELCKDVFHIPDPFNLPYEFFLIGGKKMSSSKGLGLKGRDLTALLPPSVGRFLFTRTDYKQAIEFDPMSTMAIPDLFDEFDRCFTAYVADGDESLARAFELSVVGKLPEKVSVFLPRFRDAARIMEEATKDVTLEFAAIKRAPLTPFEQSILKERVKYATVWLQTYAPDHVKFVMTKDLPACVADFSEKQREYIKKIIPALSETDPEKLQLELYEMSKTLGIPAKEAFAALYGAISGKSFGPKAAWFLLQYPRDEVVRRLKEASMVAVGSHEGSKNQTSTIQKPDFFTIDPKVKEAFPSISIGIALIRGVLIKKSDDALEKEKASLLNDLSKMTTDDISASSEIVSYRKLYKQMGIDWHSRRPSPEALLRRVVLGKSLYTVNTCVDAYNLAVMRHKVSVGAFDFASVQFPTVLRFAGAGDGILLLGDDKVTLYTEKELAYYDKNGGYNIDFNYRDAKRTMVTEKTSDAWINVDGIFDISTRQVEETLEESVALIQKYCGGSLEFSGIVT